MPWVDSHTSVPRRLHPETWSAKEFHPQINEKTSELESPMPRCPRCGALASPNILMFGDWGWVDVPYEIQRERLTAWISSVARPVVVELGAGRALPTVRRFSEKNAHQRLIRINLRDPDTGPSHGVGFEREAAAILKLLDAQFCVARKKTAALD